MQASSLEKRFCAAFGKKFIDVGTIPRNPGHARPRTSKGVSGGFEDEQAFLGYANSKVFSRSEASSPHCLFGQRRTTSGVESDLPDLRDFYGLSAHPTIMN